MRGILVAGCLLTCVTACSGDPAPAPVPTTRPATAAPRTTAPPPFKSPDKVTAACPFLEVADVVAAIGGVWNATATDQKPEKNGAATTFTCTYASEFHDSAAFRLSIVTGPADRSPTATIDSWAKSCTNPATTIPTTADKAQYCDLPDATVDGIPEQVAAVMVGKLSHGESRTAKLDLHKIRADAYTKLATLLAGRL